MTVTTLAFVALGVWHWQGAGQTEVERARAPAERVYKVRAGILQAVSVTPEIATFGRIKSWRRAPLSAAVAGDVIWIADALRDGAAIPAGTPLLRIDPLIAELALAEAENALREAEARKAEAEAAIAFTQAELEAARAMLALRDRQWQRQQELAGTGSTSKAALDNAQMDLVNAEQALAARRMAMVRAENEVTFSALAIQSARIARDRARRDLEDTSIEAPFAGVLSRVDVALGREVNAGTVLAELIDLSAFEVEIDLTAADLNRLLDETGRLRPQAVTIRQRSAGLELSSSGHLLRTGAEVAATGSGRVVYASLDTPERTPFRPGDFVDVAIAEPVMNDVALVPAAALDERDQLLVIDADDRLASLPVRVAGRVGEQAVLRDVPFGQLYVAGRQTQLSAGVRVEIANDPAIDDLLSLDDAEIPANGS